MNCVLGAATRFPVCAFLAFLIACFRPASACAQEQWVEVKSPHFSVLTDGGEKRGREVSLQFEQMRSVFAQLFLQDKISASAALRVIAMKSEKQVSQFAPMYQGKPVKIVGFYLHSTDEDFILVDLGAPNRWETVFHEYAHLLLGGNFPDLPAWFSEGLAQFYSTIEIDDNWATIGRAPVSAPQMLAGENLIPITVLLAVDHNSPLYNDDHDRRSMFYAESWLVVHYLWDNHKLEQAQKYLQLARGGMPANDAFKTAFGMGPAQFDAALDKYRRARVERLRLPLPAGLEKVAMAGSPASALDVAAVLADLHSHQTDYAQQSIAEFQNILRQDPENVVAHRGLGFALFNQHDSEAAMPHLRKAAEKMPDDWLVHYYSASVMAQKQDDALADQIEKEARLVTMLNPGIADGFGLLGFALMTQKKNPEATTAYENALRLSPASEVYALNLAELYSLQGKIEEAKALFARLQNSLNPRISVAARSHLELMAPAPRK